MATRKGTGGSAGKTHAHRKRATVGQQQDRHAAIAEAAYLRSKNRGFAPGHELDDWLAAEAEIDERHKGGAS